MIGFKELYQFHNQLIGLLFFPYEGVEWTRIEKDKEFALMPDTVLVFNMPNVDVKADAMFHVNGKDSNDNFRSQCRIPLYDKGVLHCMVITDECVFSYNIPDYAYDSGDGMYVLSEIPENINVMMSIVFDGISGNILAVTSKETTISEVEMNDIKEIIAKI